MNRLPSPDAGQACRLTGPLLFALVTGCGLLVACGDSASPGATVAPQPSPTIHVIPYEGPVICAGESTDSFADVQEQAAFQLYCPTYVPDGFTFESIQLEEPTGSPAGSIIARAGFRRSDPPGELQLLQGQPGLLALTDLVRGKDLRDTIAYSDFPANLFDDAVLARSPEGYTQIIAGEGISTEELRQISGRMQRVPGLLPAPASSPASP